MLILIVILLSLSGHIFPQEYFFKNKIGNFKDASSFYITSAGILYITDAADNQVFKYDTIGVLLKINGGYGWDRGAFDLPVDIFANPLQVIVTDYNNHRIQRFDKDLNFISAISTRDSQNEEIRFGYPLSAAISPQGDLYILDSENIRIIKFDLFGNFILHFGGFDWGNFALKKPVKIAVSQGSNVFAADENKILFFDQFGSGIGSINTDISIKNLNIVFNNLNFNDDERIFHINLRADSFQINEIYLTGYDYNYEIVSSFIFNNKLYVLTPREILIFSLPSE
jgi:hypothetical protein